MFNESITITKPVFDESITITNEHNVTLLGIFETMIASIKEDISEFRQELRMLKDFKEFCKRFANGRHME